MRSQNKKGFFKKAFQTALILYNIFYIIIIIFFLHLSGYSLFYILCTGLDIFCNLSK